MKRNNLQSIFCAIPLLLVYAFCLSSNSKSESVVECCKHVLLKLTHSNTVVAIVSFQTNMPNDKATSVYITTNTILRSFCNEAAFGERWILEGWSSKCGSQKQ